MANEITTKARLKNSGANDSLASAVAAAAAETDLESSRVEFAERSNLCERHIMVQIPRGEAVPDALHDRLTEMGFEVAEGYDAEGADRYGCKYVDTRY